MQLTPGGTRLILCPADLLCQHWGGGAVAGLTKRRVRCWCPPGLTPPLQLERAPVCMITVTLQELTGLQEEDRAGELLWCRLAIKQPTGLRFGRTSAVACSASGDGFFGEDVVFMGLTSAPGTLVVDVWSGKQPPAAGLGAQLAAGGSRCVGKLRMPLSALSAQSQVTRHPLQLSGVLVLAASIAAEEPPPAKTAASPVQHPPPTAAKLSPPPPLASAKRPSPAKLSPLPPLGGSPPKTTPAPAPAPAPAPTPAPTPTPAPAPAAPAAKPARPDAEEVASFSWGGVQARPRKGQLRVARKGETYLKPPGSCGSKWGKELGVSICISACEGCSIYILDVCAQARRYRGTNCE